MAPHEIVISRAGGPEVFQARELESRPLPAGKIRVAVAAAGVNFADLIQRVVREATVDGASDRTLVAVHPDTGVVRPVADLAGRTDARILFPSSGVLLMSEEGGHDRLDLLDASTFAVKKSESLDVRYHGTRMSPGRGYVAVADNTSEHAPIHLIDASTLERHVMPHDGDWLEAMWMNQRDTLMAIVFYDAMASGDAPHARILSWDVAGLQASGFVRDDAGFWTNRKMDIEVPHVKPDMMFSFTWVGVSPDDGVAVFPVLGVDPAGTETHTLLVLDIGTGEIRTVANAKGPVGFTPDGSTIVSYTEVADSTDQQLLLIDADTLDVDPQDVPIDGGITYFVSREGNYVVVGSNWGGQRLVLYDVDSDQVTEMDGPGIGLNEFVSRLGHGELWLVDEQVLYKVDLNAGTLEGVPTAFAPEHINRLPTHDWLVLDDAQTPTMVFFDPDSASTISSVTLE